MAITVGTPVNNSNAGASTLAINLGTLSTNDVCLMAGSINQTSDEDVFTSWTQTAGTSTIGTITEVVASQGPNMYLSVAIFRVTAGGTLTITGTLTASRRWAATGIPMTGVPSSIQPWNDAIGLDASTGASPVTSPTVVPETIGDVAFGIGAWEGARTGTVTTSPANWTERVDITIGGAGGDNADATLYVETFTSTDLTALAAAPTISSSTDYRHAMVIIRSAIPTAIPRRWLGLLGAGI